MENPIKMDDFGTPNLVEDSHFRLHIFQMRGNKPPTRLASKRKLRSEPEICGPYA